MGFDCTLHLVDPLCFDPFSSWLLADVAAPVPAALATDAATLRATLRDRLAQLDAGSPARPVARALLEGLLRWCSAAQPHLASRGFCAALWDRIDAPALPLECRDSLAIERALPRLLERYPALRNQLYTGLEGNSCAGHYVTPALVPAMRAHVERCLETLPDSQREGPELLLRVLTAAQNHGLGYWEATDLAVCEPAPKSKRLDPPRARRTRPAPEVRRMPLPGATVPLLNFVHEGYAVLSCVSDSVTRVLSLRDGGVRLIPGSCLSSVGAWGPGRVLAIATQARTYKRSLVDLELATGTLHPVALPAGAPQTPEALVHLHGDALLVPRKGPEAQREPLYWLRSGRTLALPPEPARDATVRGFAWAERALLVLDATPHELRGERLAPLAPRGSVKLTYEDRGDPSGSVLRDGSLYFTAAREPARHGVHGNVVYGDDPALRPRLLRFDAQGTMSEPLAELEVNGAWTAPGEALVLSVVDAPRRGALEVYWPATGERAVVPRAWLGEKAACTGGAAYAPELDALVVNYLETVYVIPWSAVEALPRTAVAAGS